MILCSCNVINTLNIQEAIEKIHSKNPEKKITVDAVFEILLGRGCDRVERWDCLSCTKSIRNQIDGILRKNNAWLIKAA